jgi:hypothetical protein
MQKYKTVFKTMQMYNTAFQTIQVQLEVQLAVDFVTLLENVQQLHVKMEHVQQKYHMHLVHVANA